MKKNMDNMCEKDEVLWPAGFYKTCRQLHLELLEEILILRCLYSNGSTCWDRWIISYFFSQYNMPFLFWKEIYVCKVFLHFNTDITC